MFYFVDSLYDLSDIELISDECKENFLKNAQILKENFALRLE
jgi:hypothetical protein